MTTYQNRYESVAHQQRRQFIERGYQVSLIAYNPESDTYDFDVITPAHLAPENCHICGYSKENHIELTGHKFWSNAEAEQDFAKEPQANTDVEARYIEQHRPY